MPKQIKDVINVDTIVESINQDNGLLDGLLQLDHDQLVILLVTLPMKLVLLILHSKGSELNSPLSLSPNGPNLPNNLVCQGMLQGSNLNVSQPLDIAFHCHCKRPCLKMLGNGKMSILRRLITKGRQG